MPAAKKSTSKKPAKKAVSEQPVSHKHFRLTKKTGNFWSFQPSVQTLYWLLIGVGVIGTTVINFNTNLRVNDLINQLNEQNQVIDSIQPSKSTSAN